jgi:hypothetical protein
LIFWHNEQADDEDYTFKRSCKCLIDNLKQNLQIQTKSPVTKLQYQIETHIAPFSEIVKVKTLVGATYYTKSLVITSSPHVLKSNLMQLDPPLSNEIVQALARTTNMHDAVKVIMIFKKPRWPKNIHGTIISNNSFYFQKFGSMMLGKQLIMTSPKKLMRSDIQHLSILREKSVVLVEERSSETLCSNTLLYFQRFVHNSYQHTQ